MSDIAVYMKSWGGDMGPDVGSIIHVAQDGYQFSSAMSIETWVSEGNQAADYHGNFGIIHAPNIPYNTVLLTEYQRNHQTFFLDTGEPTHQYKYKIDLLNLPTPWADDLKTNFVISVDWNLQQLQAFIKNRATGLFV